MFERFSDRARRLVVLAQEEARLLDHRVVGPEHLLLAITELPGCDAAVVLGRAGISLDGVRRSVILTLPSGTTPADGPLPFTPEAKTVLEGSLRAALRLGHTSLGSGHLLLGIVRQPGDIAGVVDDLGLAVDDLERAVATRWTEPGSEREAPATGSMTAVAQAGTVQLTGTRPPRSDDCALCGRTVAQLPRLVRSGLGTVCGDCARRAVAALDAAPGDGRVELGVLVTGDGPADVGAASDGVTRAFATWADSTLPPEQQLAVVRGGDDLIGAVLQIPARWEGRVRDVRRRLLWIGFRSADRADLAFVIVLADRPVLVVETGAGLVDGQWKLDRSAVERLLELAGVRVPTS